MPSTSVDWTPQEVIALIEGCRRQLDIEEVAYLPPHYKGWAELHSQIEWPTNGMYKNIRNCRLKLRNLKSLYRKKGNDGGMDWVVRKKLNEVRIFPRTFDDSVGDTDDSEEDVHRQEPVNPKKRGHSQILRDGDDEEQYRSASSPAPSRRTTTSAQSNAVSRETLEAFMKSTDEAMESIGKRVRGYDKEMNRLLARKKAAMRAWDELNKQWTKCLRELHLSDKY